MSMNGSVAEGEMTVAPVAIGLGIILVVMGVGGYVGADPDHKSMTALIPTWFGLAFLILGLLALKDQYRKHAMHLAAALGVLGVIGGAMRPASKLVNGESLQMTTPTILQLSMMILCAVFVGLCVRSFIAARRARAQRGE
jgi:hypothetical protein